MYVCMYVIVFIYFGFPCVRYVACLYLVRHVFRHVLRSLVMSFFMYVVRYFFMYVCSS